MRLLYFLFVTILLLGFEAESFAQNNKYTITNYSISEGLSHYKIQSIFKDSDGFLWIGTEDGLNRFDGTNFTLFINDPEDDKSLSSGNIFAINQDYRGRIWVGVDGGGINIINPKTYQITKIFSDNSINRAKYVKDIYIDDDNIAWIACWGGLIRYNIETEQYVIYTDRTGQGSLASTDLKKIREDSKGQLWVASSLGLSSFDKKTNSFTNYYLTNKDDALLNINIEKLFCDSDDQLWLSTASKTIYRFDKSIKEFIAYHIDPSSKRLNSANCFFEGSDNKIYIGNSGGIYVLNPFDSSNRVFTNSRLFDLGVTCIFGDVDNSFLIGSESSGLYVLKKNHFKNLSISSGKLTNNRIRTIINGEANSIWFGTRSGEVAHFNRKKNKVTQIVSHPLIKDYIIESILIDSKKELWIGTYDNGLFRYNFDSGEITQVIKGKIRIEGLFECDDNIIWIATNHQTQFFDLEKNRIVLAPNRYMLSQEMIDSHQVHFIEKDREGKIWYSVGFKVYVLDLNKGESIQVKGIQDMYEYISFEHAQDGSYYLGTLNGGVVIISPNRKIHTKTEKKGLVSNRITGMLSGTNNAIWYSTTKGLGVFGVNGENTFKKYNNSDGIKDLDFYLGAAHKDKEGWMYFGGVGGVTYFHPDSLSQKINTTKTIISHISVYDNKVSWDTIIPFKKQLRLDYTQDFFNIKFNSLDFSDRGSFKYRLLGLDNEWSSPSKLNEVSYTNLNPGEYTFEVISSNSQGEWNLTPAHIDIVITPPFWQRWWFYMLIGFSIVGMVFIAIKIRERELKKEAESAQFKLQALRSQMNPHFIFNSLNSIQHFIIKNETKFALKYLTKFSKLVRKILENSFHIRIPLSEELKFLSNYIEIESLRFDNNIDYEIEIDEKINLEDVEIPSMLIQPYVENSILHGLMHKSDGGVIQIRFSAQKKVIQCIIEDDGVGRKASKEINDAIGKTHNSFGLPITKSRLEELNKTRGASVTVAIEDILMDNQIKGTRVILNIPID